MDSIGQRTVWSRLPWPSTPIRLPCSPTAKSDLQNGSFSRGYGRIEQPRPIYPAMANRRPARVYFYSYDPHRCSWIGPGDAARGLPENKTKVSVLSAAVMGMTIQTDPADAYSIDARHAAGLEYLGALPRGEIARAILLAGARWPSNRSPWPDWSTPRCSNLAIRGLHAGAAHRPGQVQLRADSAPMALSKPTATRTVPPEGGKEGGLRNQDERTDGT